ncbi:MAG: long-chain fatty acid--CoA ligase [Candidatus Aminicenantes bacterium]|nr:long-chain fatty acid--CoA ligase [Candidatus Aminicenantes bacterium]
MVATLAQLFLNTVRKYSKDDLMLFKKEGKYQPISTAEFEEKVINLALALQQLGLKKGDKLVIFSENRPEWVMMDFATICQGGLTVPIYTSLTGSQAEYIINDSDATFVVVSSPEIRKKVESVRNNLSKVKYYITFEEEKIDGFLNFFELLEMGKKVGEEEPGLFEKLTEEVKPEDEASLIYTSGTTGVPKGVILTHHNFISNVKTCVAMFDISFRDTVLSFLPLSHVLERMVMFSYLYAGATIAFAESIEAVAQNLIEVKPHIMVSVPRVFEKIYARVMDNILNSPPLKRRIFFWAYGIGKKYAAKQLKGEKIPAVLKLKRKIAHKLVFSKIIERTGGRVRFFISGGAPLAKDIAEFFYALGLVIYEGYGLTETAPVLAVNRPGALKFGTVGQPIPEVEIKIAPDGEILARGPNVMKGYYKKEAETREVFEGGWFHTGDIGYLDEDGFLVITDRKKDIIVTSGGKNVAPQAIENLLKTSPYISTAVVIGDRKKFISALIVPNFEKLEALAREKGWTYASRQELVNKPEVVDLIQSEIDRACVGLASYEKIKRIALLDHDFEIEKGEITPTLKVRRAVIENRYRELIDSLYREDSSGSSDEFSSEGSK